MPPLRCGAKAQVMSAIHRYEVPVDDATHTFELHSEPLAVGLRKPLVVEFWAVHNDLIRFGQVRAFCVVGTGHPLPSNFVRHWGHAYDFKGEIVWHLIEVKP